MSTPDPAGGGALAAMGAALRRSRLKREDIGYVNLHGTATPANDLAEDRAVVDLFGEQMPCSSTKGWTGHTLGAAGIVEAAISLLALEHGLLPRSLNTRERDPALRGAILMENREAPLAYALSNSFGFGGSNCSLLFGAQP
jgi:3-oxoacyl-[acyl-carrier-protein] synthase I